MSDCSVPDVVGRVRRNPTLGFAVFDNMVIFVFGAWLWFLSLWGIMSWTGAKSITQFIYFILSGLASVFTGISQQGETVSAAKQSIESEFGTRAVAMLTAAVVVAIGWYLRDSPTIGSFILIMFGIIASILYFSPFEFPLTLPIMGGIVVGMTVNTIIWMIDFFTVEEGNATGSVVFMSLTIWVLMTLLAWHGSKVVKRRGRGRPRGRDPETEQRDRALAWAAQQQQNEGLDDDGYPKDRWAREFAVQYVTLYRETTGTRGRPPKEDIRAAFASAYDEMKADYDELGAVDMKDIAEDNFPEDKYQIEE